MSNRLLNPFYFFLTHSNVAAQKLLRTWFITNKKTTNKITHLERVRGTFEGKFLVQNGKKLNYDQWDEHTKKCPFNATSKRIYSINFETKWKNKLIQPHLFPFLYRPVSTFFPNILSFMRNPSIYLFRRWFERLMSTLYL